MRYSSACALWGFLTGAVCGALLFELLMKWGELSVTIEGLLLIALQVAGLSMLLAVTVYAVRVVGRLIDEKNIPSVFE